MVNVALIDADILIWLASYEKNHISECKEYLGYKIEEIVSNTGSDMYKLFVGGDNNFRYLVRDDYKANRSRSEKPFLFDDTKRYMIEEMNAFVSNGVETDDTICATAKWCDDTGLFNPIVATIDKDYMIKPLTIYRWRRESYNGTIEPETIVVSEDEAFHNLCLMLLTGDSGDNIRTCKGVGKAKANKLLDGKSNYDKVRSIVEVYKQYYKSKWRVKLNEVYALINLIDDYNRVRIPSETEFDIIF